MANMHCRQGESKTNEITAYIEKTAKPGDSTDPTEPDDPVKPGDSTDPTEPDNPDNPPTGRYTLSSVADAQRFIRRNSYGTRY